MKTKTPVFLACLIMALSLCHFPWQAVKGATPAEIQQSIEALRSVGAEGKGNTEAAAAWKSLSTAGNAAILPLLESFNGAGPMAQNWLRSALEVIVSEELNAGRSLPMEVVGSYLLDTRNNPLGRRLAFELISQSDPDTAAKMVPGMLHDPSPQLRRDAVQELIQEADSLSAAKKTHSATLLYRQALNGARDSDQIKQIAGKLEKLNQKVDLPRHFGFLTHWKIIAPFDNSERKGFSTVFPPEKEIDLNAKYKGKDGEEIGWQDIAVSDAYGMLDLNKPFGLLKEVTGYAYTELEFDNAGPAEIRIGCKNGWKIWFNGEFIFGRDEYHRGMKIDQYTLPVQLKKGKNTLLVKLCQNEQKERWTVEWQAQIRICDAGGTAILASNRLPTPKAEEPGRRELKK